MDWEFYGILFFVLFGIVAILLTVKFLFDKRIEHYEQKRRKEKEARQISETNSGL
jgi:regulatory protein YycI of two-component signal transduction system YycFG